MFKEFGFQMPLIQGARMRSEEVALVFPTMFRANNIQTNRVGYDDNHVGRYDDRHFAANSLLDNVRGEQFLDRWGQVVAQYGDTLIVK